MSSGFFFARGKEDELHNHDYFFRLRVQHIPILVTGWDWKEDMCLGKFDISDPVTHCWFTHPTLSSIHNLVLESFGDINIDIFKSFHFLHGIRRKEYG